MACYTYYFRPLWPSAGLKLPRPHPGIVSGSHPDDRAGAKQAPTGANPMELRPHQGFCHPDVSPMGGGVL
jgi:hypothetical protein